MTLLELLQQFWPLVLTLAAGLAGLKLAHYLLLGRKSELGSERRFFRQIILICLILVWLVAVIFALPVAESSRNQLLGLIGLLFSGMIGFSSTNIVANFMSGLLLRITRPFRTGDFIRVNEYFGRVAERGLFDTEIQSESRELIALPNTYLITNPVSTVRTSGTIISTELSLGYDVSHSVIEPLLLKAASQVELEDPFVHILKLGDFSVTYRVAGMLKEVKWLLSARSNLNRSVLDTLHAEGIEIMSPVYQAQRRVEPEFLAIPSIEVRDGNDSSAAAATAAAAAAAGYASAKSEVQSTVQSEDSTAGVGVGGSAPTQGAEAVVFDKAEKAEQNEQKQLQLNEEIKQLEEKLKDLSSSKDSTAAARTEQLKQRRETCRERIEELKQQAETEIE